MVSNRYIRALAGLCVFFAVSAQATCHEAGLFAVPSIRESVRRSRGLPPAATAIPSPNAPQNLSELHDRMNDALVFALDRGQDIPSFTLNASAPANFRNFGVSELVGIPDRVTLTGGRTANPFLRVRYLTAGGLNATCYYKAAGGGYAFDFCAASDFEPVCIRSMAPCRGPLNLGIHAGDAVIAHQVQIPVSDCDRVGDGDDDNDRDYHQACSGTFSVSATFPNVNAACEGLAKGTVHFLENLSCATPNHVGLEVWADKASVEGHGFAIRSPGSEIGLFVVGSGTAVRNLEVSGVSGYGLMAYDTNGFKLQNNRLRGNLVGANIYTDSATTTGLEVSGNDMSGNAFSALIFSGDGVRTDNPSISGNSFANTGGYAVAIDAQNAALNGSQNNVYSGSRGALYLSSGNFTITNLDLSRSGATGPQIFVDSAQNLSVSNVNLTYTAPALSSQEREALHLYRVGTATVSKLTVTNSDVGFKATTEMGTNTVINLTGSTLTNAKTAAVMLQSWDSTSFGKVSITGNKLTGAPAGYSIWTVGATSLGAGSVTSGNQQ